MSFYLTGEPADGPVDDTRDDTRDELKERAARRERIATAVLSGLVGDGKTRDTTAEFARVAIALADALIAELDKEPQP